MPLPIAAALGIAAAAAAASAAQSGSQSYYGQKNLNRQAQADYRRNMKMSQRLNLQTLSQTTKALRDAGLSPALAGAGTTAAPASASPTSSNFSVSPVPVDVAGVLGSMDNHSMVPDQKENLQSQTNLNNAMADKARADAGKTPEEIKLIQAQTEEKRLFNTIIKDKNKVAADFVSGFFARKADSPDINENMREFYRAWSERAKNMSVGSLDALMTCSRYLNDLSDYDRNAVENALYKKLAELKLGSDDVLFALSQMSVAEFKRTLAQIDDLVSSRKLKDVQREEVVPLEKQLLVAQAGETEERGALEKAQRENLPYQMELQRHQNFTQMIDDGEYGNAAWSLVPMILNGLSNVLIMRYFKGGASAPSFGRGFGSGSSGSPSTSNVSSGSHRSTSGRSTSGPIPRDMPREAQQALDNYYRGEYGD